MDVSRIGTLARNAVVVALAMIAFPAVASADTFTVTQNQEGPGSFRQAITDAEAHPGPDTIAFAPGLGGYLIIDVQGHGALQISSELRIDGPGVETLQVLATGGPLFRVDASANATIAGLHLLHVGGAGGAQSLGGAIQNQGTLTLSGILIEECRAGSADGTRAAGGAISNTGSMTVTGSTLKRNVADAGAGAAADGGAIVNSGTLTVDKSRLINNAAQGGDGLGAGQAAGTGSGGGIHNTGSLVVTDSTLVSNLAGGGRDSNEGGAGVGGAIYNAGNGTLTLRNSTLNDNIAGGGSGAVAGLAIGGGIENFGTASFRLENATLEDNSAAPGYGAHQDTQSIGGGIDNQANFPQKSTVLSSTIAGNSARQGGNIDASSAISLKNTILSNPRDGKGGASDNCGHDTRPSAVSSLGYNLESGNSCGLKGTGDQTGTDPKLGALADNGGPTQTMSIGSSSPALDQGVAAGLDTDQRGLKRPVRFDGVPKPAGGDGADIGAFELQAGPGGIDRSIVGSVEPGRATTGERTCFGFDARKRVDGDGAGPLRDVKVRFAGEIAHTGPKGGARICNRFDDPGVRNALLSKDGFESDRVRVKVVRP